MRKRPRRGPGQPPLSERDDVIRIAAKALTLAGYKRKRGKDKHSASDVAESDAAESACSIIVKALARCGIKMEESTVEKATDPPSRGSRRSVS
jgi:hypothetical protein